MKANLIVPCGGSGSRSGYANKLLTAIDLVGTPVIVVTLSKFIAIDEITRIILPCAEHALSEFKEVIIKYFASDVNNSRIQFCIGGGTRSESVKAALKLVEEDSDLTIIHDGARPHVTSQIITESLATALQNGSAIAAVPAVDTLAIIGCDSKIISVPGRNTLVHLQTPQTFLTKSIIRAYDMINDGEVFTDDSSVYSAKIGSPTISKGDPINIKLTYSTDFAPCGNVLVGVGYDIHRLVENRPLILGGVNIPHTKGLLGHSDADALIHAVMDAILTACHQRDIGVLFPDTDEKYRGIDSTLLLKEVYALISKQGYSINNISAVIMAQSPKLNKHIPQMIERLANILNIPISAIGISATTTEGLGFIGREEGIASHATCTVIKH